MKTSLALLHGAVLGTLSFVAAAQTATPTPMPTPAAGLWEISSTMEGAPMGGGTRSGKACLTAEALASSPEMTLLEAAGRQGNGRDGPKCELKDLQRQGPDSTWTAQCQGPMGRMQGTGSARLSSDTASLQLAFNVKAPIGSLSLKQSVSGRRIGDC